MCAISRYRALPALLASMLIAVTMVANSQASAQEPRADFAQNRARLEVWLALSSWPGIGDLRPAAGGSFDTVGYGLGVAAHWPVMAFGSSNLLLGIEGAIMVNESDVPVYFDELLARDGYVAVSAKWLVGDKRRLSLDAGLGFHLLDMAQLETDYYLPVEFQSWEESAVGLFVGANWDVGAGRPDKHSGLSLGLRVHFMDFGTVRDEDILFEPLLGDDAGDLSGPMVALQIGYRWR